MTEHNLLKLVDVLRTISDENVSFDCMKLVLNESTSQHFDQMFPQQANESTTNNVTRCAKNWRKMIQFGITSHYKNTQDFDCISNTHDTLRNCNKFIESQSSISISPIPKPSVRIHNHVTQVDNDKLTTTEIKEFIFTEKVFLIESIMINIFQFLTLDKLSLCRSVCQQWLYDASNPLSIYHADTFYIRKMLDHFVNWKILGKDSFDDETWKDIQKEIKRLIFREEFEEEFGDNFDMMVDRVFCYNYYDVYVHVCIPQSNQYLNNLAKYNLKLLQYCQSLTIDVNHFDYHENRKFYSIVPENVLKPLSNVQTLKIIVPENFEHSLFHLSHWIEINGKKSIKSVELAVTAEKFRDSRCTSMIQRMVKDLSQIKNNTLNSNCNNDGDHDGDKGTKVKYMLNVDHLQIYTNKHVYSCHEIVSWFENVDLSMIKSIKLNVLMDNCVKTIGSHNIKFFGYDHIKVHPIEYVHKQIKYTGYFDTGTIIDHDQSQICGSASTWQKLIDIISQWNRLIDQFNCKREKRDSSNCMNNNHNHNIKIEGINLLMSIDVNKGDSWMNASTNLSKSAKLVNVIQSLYNWYDSGNIGANLIFRVLHVIDKSFVENIPYFDRKNACKRILVNEDLRQQGWIKLIVKALVTVFKCQNNCQIIIHHFYPFGLFSGYEQSKCIKLLDRVTIKLFAPKWVNKCNNSRRKEH